MLTIKRTVCGVGHFLKVNRIFDDDVLGYPNKFDLAAAPPPNEIQNYVPPMMF